MALRNSYCLSDSTGLFFCSRAPGLLLRSACLEAPTFGTVDGSGRVTCTPKSPLLFGDPVRRAHRYNWNTDDLPYRQQGWQRGLFARKDRAPRQVTRLDGVESKIALYCLKGSNCYCSFTFCHVLSGSYFVIAFAASSVFGPRSFS